MTDAASVMHQGKLGTQRAGTALRTVCTSRTRPCAHVLAVYYETARRLDERPRLALTLRHADTARAGAATSRIPLALVDPANFYGHHHGSR